MNDADIESRLAWAREAAERASGFIMRYFQAPDLQIETKSDRSPVTLADQGAEELLRAEIGQYFPQDGILGEEFGTTTGSSGFQWILDPIDGTKSFIHGAPQFGTLIGLLYREECVAGLCRFPALNEVVFAQRGQGTYWQLADGSTRRATISPIPTLSESLFCYTSVRGWMQVERLATFEDFCRSSRIARGWGDCYGHILVATGRAEIMIDPLLNPWDAAALVPIVLEAGGVFSDWNGATTIHGGNGISTTPALHAAVMQKIQPLQNQ